jgi:hypothetical protein
MTRATNQKLFAGWTHQQLCDRALRWLSGTRRCEPVFAGIASCSEVPDAIGWSSCYSHKGSTVIECKTSRTDFYAENRKRFVWKHPEWNYFVSARRYSEKSAIAQGFKKEVRAQMGHYRFFMCEPEIITPEMVQENAPDHGLLWVKGRSVSVIVNAPRRTNIAFETEIRYLRFAIINSKTPHVLWPEEATAQLAGLGRPTGVTQEKEFRGLKKG